MIHANILSNSYLELISKSSIKRILKEKLNLTYKKANFVNQINMQRERIRRFYDSIQIKLSLINNRYEIIFFDEFSSNSGHNTIYNWGVKGEKSFAIVNKETFSMSFCIGFSSKRLYRVMRTTATFDSIKIWKFIGQLLSERKNYFGDDDNRFVLVWDNAKIHVSRTTSDFIKRAKVNMITILSYSPSH